MLKTAVSLWLQCLLYLMGRLEDFPTNALALLPSSLKKWLLLNLPVVDILKLENGLVQGMNMEEIWRIRSIRLQGACLMQLEGRGEGFWRERCMEQLWEVAMTDPCGNWMHSYLQTTRLEEKAFCHWHRIQEALFALKLDCEISGGEWTDIYKLSSTVLTNSSNQGRPYNSGIYNYHCHRCSATMHIPTRYVKHFLQEYNLILLLTLFYSFTGRKFKPQSVTLSHLNMSKSGGPLSNMILKTHPDVLSEIVGKVQFLKLLPMYFNTVSSSKNHIDHYNTILACLYSSGLKASLLELNIQLTLLPFEVSSIKDQFESLQFLSITTLHQNVLKIVFTSNLISTHLTSLRVLDINKCSFPSRANLTALTDLFRSRQFSAMTFNQTRFFVSSFLEVLYNFVSSTGQQHQILSFKNTLLEGNRRPFSINMEPSPAKSGLFVATKTLSIECVRAAFNCTEQLQQYLQHFPYIYLRRLNLKEIKAIEMISLMPLVQAHDLCISISTPLSKHSLGILHNFFDAHKFGSVSICIEKGFIASSTSELLQLFGKYIASPNIPLKSLKLTWMSEDCFQDQSDSKSSTALLEELFMTIFTSYDNRMKELILDFSEHYGTQPCPCETLYKAWIESGNKERLHQLIINRETALNSVVPVCDMATIVIETSTTCDI